MTSELVKPNLSFCSSYRSYRSEFIKREERLIPFSLRHEDNDDDVLISRFQNDSLGTDLGEGIVPSSTFWMISSNEVVGLIEIRHGLTEKLKEEGGHIGYSIRPSKRGSGLGKEILHLGIDRAKELSLESLLITCHKSNTLSSKVILSNGGTFIEEKFVPRLEDIIQYYSIEI